MNCKKNMYRVYADIFLLALILLGRIVEKRSLEKRIGCPLTIFKKGNGSLNKYLCKKDKKCFLIKKKNRLIDYRVDFFAKKIKNIQEESLQKRFDNLRVLMKNEYFNKKTLLLEVHDDYLLYRFIEGAKTLDEVVLRAEEKEYVFQEIKKFVHFLKRKGYFTEELYLHNIILHEGEVLFIDLEGIVSLKTKKNNIEKDLLRIKEELYGIKKSRN